MRWVLILLYIAFALQSTAQTCGGFIGGYIPSWRNPATVDYSKLSHAYYAFALTNDAGDLLTDNVSTTFVAFKTASAGKQRFLSLAGGGAHEIFSSMTNSETAIATFVDNCVAFCQTHELQGIDVDWEAITTPQDSVKFGKLVRALAGSLHEVDLQLVITLAYGSYGGDHYNVGVLKKADWIQLMVYDQTATWSASPYGNHSSFSHVLDAIQYWSNRGFTDLSKMVLGLPFYGYHFNSTAGGLGTALTYADIMNANPGIGCNQDEVNMTFFNGPGTIRKKVQYAIERGMKGVMIWEMGQDLPSTDSRSLLKAVSDAFCELPGLCDPILAVEADMSEGKITLLKNPVTNSIDLDLQDSKGDVVEMVMTDLAGRTVLSQGGFFDDEVTSLSIGDQPTGIYILMVRFRNQKPFITRILKM